MSQQIWASFAGCTARFSLLPERTFRCHPHSCRRQTSKYTCPSCNLFYCSLGCFRSEVCFPAPIALTPDDSPRKLHSQCSEVFYRKEIEIGIKSSSSKSEEDRTKMLELLKRIQDDSAADEVGLLHLSDEENEEDSFAHRFSTIDICGSLFPTPF